MPFCFSSHLFSNSSSSPAAGNSPGLSPWNTGKEGGSVPTREARRCCRPAANRPVFVLLPGVRLVFSPTGSPKSTDHIILDNLVDPLRFAYQSSPNCSSSPDLVAQRFTELLLSGWGCGFPLATSFASAWTPRVAPGQTVESAQHDGRRAWRAGVLPPHGRGQASALLPPSPSGYFSEESSHPATTPTPRNADRVGRAGPSPENAGSLLSAHLPPGPWDVCRWSSDGTRPLTAEPRHGALRGCSWPGAARLGRRARITFVLSPAFALPEPHGSPRGNPVPQPRQAKLLI